MLRFATRTDPVTGARAVNVSRVTDLVRSIGLVVVLVTVIVASPRPGTGDPRQVAIAVTLAVSAIAWVAWILSDRVEWLTVGSLIVMGGAGGVLAGVSPNSPALAIGCAATARRARRPLRPSRSG